MYISIIIIREGSSPRNQELSKIYRRDIIVIVHKGVALEAY